MALEEEDKLMIDKMYELVHSGNFRQREFQEQENRNPYQRDYARILYSSSFRRLQGKMQILGVDNTSYYRNRLTHSLEVAQIATGILLNIKKQIGKENIPIDDYFVLEAAALAHDIGHPAFGHSGERVLNKLGEKYELRFEGNAHNFRVLRKLEKKFPDKTGLNLTYRTLLAINKYLSCEDDSNDKFLFKEDYTLLYGFRQANDLLGRRTIDVQIIELADDIAYAVHDLEDGLSTRNFNIDEVIYKLSLIKDSKLTGFEDFKKTVEDARNEALKSKTYQTNQEYSLVFRNTLTSMLTKLLMSDISLSKPDETECNKRGTDKEYKELSLGKYSALCKELSREVFKCITREPHIAIYEARGEKLITDLFNLYSNPDLNKNGYLFPPDFRKDLIRNKNSEKDINTKLYAQSTIDYIAGMMDDYAKAQYERFFNKSFKEIDLTVSV